MTDPPEPRLPYRFEETRTERLRLRMMVELDVDDVFAYQSRSDVCKYLLFEPRDRRAVAEKIATWSQRRTLERDGDFLELAVERTRDGRVIGDLYFHVKHVEHACVELGWAFNPDHQGQGYATEAASEALRLAFEAIGMHRVIAEVDPRNEASVALCLRLGMRQEAHFVDDIWFKGAWASTAVYAVREIEWRASLVGGPPSRSHTAITRSGPPRSH